MMYYNVPSDIEDIIALNQNPIDEELIATAIAGVIEIARHRGQSLEDLTTELLHDDNLLSLHQRHQLSMVIAQAWQTMD